MCFPGQRHCSLFSTHSFNAACTRHNSSQHRFVHGWWLSRCGFVHPPSSTAAGIPPADNGADGKTNNDDANDECMNEHRASSPINRTKGEKSPPLARTCAHPRANQSAAICRLRTVLFVVSLSCQSVEAQFTDFMGQINALKIVVVQLEQKLRQKSEEQVRWPVAGEGCMLSWRLSAVNVQVVRRLSLRRFVWGCVHANWSLAG